MTSRTVARLAVVVGATALGLAACERAGSSDGARERAAGQSLAIPAAKPAAAELPRLVDLGAGKCIPCKAMAPILDQLRTDFAGRLEVVFVDVWKAPEAAEPYRIQMIPTQIFYGADGRELARHQGFMSREEILAQWKAVGVEL
jgi:thioredoxin 1